MGGQKAVRFSLVVLFFLGSASLCMAQVPKLTDASGGDSGIGGDCPRGHAGYTWTTVTKTEWRLKDVGVAPDGSDPEDWESRKDLAEKLAGAAGGNRAEVVAKFWGTYATTAVGALYVKFEQVTTTVTREIRCVNGKWKITSDSQETDSKESDWIKTKVAPPVSTASATDVKAGIEGALRRLIAASGGPANTEPQHSYTTP